MSDPQNLGDAQPSSPTSADVQANTAAIVALTAAVNAIGARGSAANPLHVKADVDGTITTKETT